MLITAIYWVEHCLSSPFTGSSIVYPRSVAMGILDKFQNGLADDAGKGGKRGGDSLSDEAASLGGGAKPKRSCLRHYDLMSGQVLNPMGRSGISETPSKTIWELCMKGNAGCDYHSELCDAAPTRRNVGLSRTAEVLHKAIDRLTTSKKVGQLLKPAILAAVKSEAAELQPHLNQLWNKDVVSGNKQNSARSMAYAANRPGAVVNKDAIEAAAKFFHAWLSRPETELKEVLCALSDGGGFFTAEVTIEVAEAFVAHGGGDEAAMVIAAHARGVNAIVTTAPSATAVGVLDGYA